MAYEQKSESLLKNAKKISEIFDAKVSVVIFDQFGNMKDFSQLGEGGSLTDILNEYQKKIGYYICPEQVQQIENEKMRVAMENEAMKAELRRRKGQEINRSTLPELGHYKELLNENTVPYLKQMQMDRQA